MLCWKWSAVSFCIICIRKNRRGSCRKPEPVLSVNHRWPSAPESWGWIRHCRWAKGEESTGGRQRDSIISDSVEATIGAIFLDGGITNAKEFILKHVLNDIDKKRLFYDSKTILQELVQGHMEGRIALRAGQS